MNIRTFWKGEFNGVENNEPGKALPGMVMTVKEMLRDGTIDEVSNRIKKNMIFGKRITLNDLSELDSMKDKIRRYENMMKDRVKAERKTNTEVGETTENLGEEAAA